MAMKSLFGIIAVGGVALVLQGCGGGGGSTTVTTTMTTTGTTSSTTRPPRSKPMTSVEAAAYLNKLYLSFNASNDTSQIGVTISMAANVSGFFGNIFCSHFYNPAFNAYGSCYKGQADCRMSTSVLSHGWMIDDKTKAIAAFGERRAGYVFNQTMVESRWAKCSYIWDGASFRLYNRGCGDGAPADTCDKDADSAYNNQCSKSGAKHTCTPADDEVKRAICAGPPGGDRPVPPTHGGAGNAECVFPGPAFGYTGQDNYEFMPDHTRYMAKMRLKYNYGADSEGNNSMKNNEVVLDEELLIKDIWEDPVSAIPAILYTARTDIGGINRNKAIAIRDDLCNVFGCTQNGGGLIPLVKVDDTRYYPQGPFFADSPADASIAV
jgi:hypothetical protein